MKRYKVYATNTIFGNITLHVGMVAYAEKYKDTLVKLTTYSGKQITVIKQEEARNSLKYYKKH